jgi:hypothetical protein
MYSHFPETQHETQTSNRWRREKNMTIIEHPILFQADMVRAILNCRKTMTRRVIKPQPVMMDSGAWFPSSNPGDSKNRTGLHYANEYHLRKGLPIDFSPYGQPGDRLWVRETHVFERYEDEPYWLYLHYRATDRTPDLDYEDDEDGDPKCKWRPSIFMPRWASRITLEIVSIRAERVQEISEEDANLEGVDFIPSAPAATNHRTSFAGLWDSINAKRGFGWDVNPWVWVIEFKRVR